MEDKMMDKLCPLKKCQVKLKATCTKEIKKNVSTRTRNKRSALLSNKIPTSGSINDDGFHVLQKHNLARTNVIFEFWIEG